MKRSVKVKNLIAFTTVLILLFSITAIPAYAEFPPLTTAGRRLGAFLLAAIQAINITLTSTAAQSVGADIMDYIADPMDVQYSYHEMWEDQPKIQIWEDYVNIDGVEYTDVWISNEAATKFQVDAYDFQSAYNIASNSNGTFASGVGHVEGLPVFNINNVRQSQKVEIPFSAGSYDVGESVVTQTPYDNPPTQMNFALRTSKNSNYPFTRIADDYYPVSGQFIRNGQDYGFRILSNNGTELQRQGYTYVEYDNTAFDFDYVSGTIPSKRILDPDEGMMLRIPSDSIPAITQFVTDNPEFAEPGGAPIDVDIDPDIMNKLDDLIDIIAPIIPIIKAGDINFTVNHEAPIPPVPDTPIVDATVPQVVNPIINEITNYGDQITEQIPQIIETMPTIDSICENIDTAPYHDLDTGLDKLPTIFLPFITDLRSALGIWHYVTEWLAQISTTFAFISGCLVGTSIMTPIYAAIAGFMCIKIYRRMTA